MMLVLYSWHIGLRILRAFPHSPGSDTVHHVDRILRVSTQSWLFAKYLTLPISSQVPHAGMKVNKFLVARYIVFGVPFVFAERSYSTTSGLFSICNAITCSVATWNLGFVQTTRPRRSCLFNFRCLSNYLCCRASRCLSHLPRCIFALFNYYSVRRSTQQASRLIESALEFSLNCYAPSP